MNEKVRIHILVSGFVQGVFFRDNSQKKAQGLGLTGWVKNLSDGRVEIVAEGEKQKLEDLIKWVNQGPTIAKVDNIEVEWQEYKGEFNSFNIRY